MNGYDDDKTCNTPLHYSASFGSVEMVKLLCGMYYWCGVWLTGWGRYDPQVMMDGLNGNDDNKTCNTSLHYAASFGSVEMVKLLCGMYCWFDMRGGREGSFSIQEGLM